MKQDPLYSKMKEYETVSQINLEYKKPVVVRIDGRAFHTFTKGFKKPFDMILCKSMWETLQYLCTHIEGCVFGYTQSDEISLVLCDFQKENTSAWFDYNLQKICSIIASITTAAFNNCFQYNVDMEFVGTDLEIGHSAYVQTKTDGFPLYKLATFDTRAFNIPTEDLVEYFVWRQRDCIRNSVQAVAQSQFSHASLNNKSIAEQLAMLNTKGIDWETDCSASVKFGVCCFRVPQNIVSHGNTVTRSKWITAHDIPLFEHNSEYILKHIPHISEEKTSVF